MKYFDSKDGGRIGGSLKSFPIQFSKLWLMVIDLRIRSRSPIHTSYCVLCTIVQAAVYQYSQTANKLFLQRAQHKLGCWRITKKWRKKLAQTLVKQTCMELLDHHRQIVLQKNRLPQCPTVPATNISKNCLNIVISPIGVDQPTCYFYLLFPIHFSTVSE